MTFYKILVEINNKINMLFLVRIIYHFKEIKENN